MSEYRYVPIVQRAQQAVGHLLRFLIERGVHAGYDNIHLLKHGVAEIELAIGQDVHFNPGHDRDAVSLLIGSTDASDVLLGSLIIQPIGESQVLGVVGNRNIFVAALLRRLGHLVNGAAPVGFDSVHVHFTANVFDGNEAWQLVFRGRFDFAEILAQLGRNPVQLELAVDFFFRCTGHALVVVESKQAIFVERQTHLECALAQRDVVVLRAGEVLHGCAIRFRRQSADVHLHSTAQLEADLVVALGEYLLNAREAQNLLDERGAPGVVNAARSGNEHVKIADGLATAAQRAGGRDLLDALDVLQVLGQFLRGAVGFVDQEASSNAAIILDCLQDFLLALLAQPRQLAQLAFARQIFHPSDIAHLEGAPQQRAGLRAEPLDLQQLQHRWPVFLQQLLMNPKFAAAAQLLDVRRHAFANAGNLQQLLRIVQQGGDLLRNPFESLSGAAIGADAERVAAVDLHQVSGFVEDVGDGLIVHAEHPSGIVTCTNRNRRRATALRFRPE